MGRARPLGGPGFDVVEVATATIRRYNMLEAGDRVLVAVSGGPDSTCLLDVLWRLATRFEIEIEIAHVDHGLGKRSEKVAGRVATKAAEAGFEVHVVRAPDLSGPNLHARARDFRYAFLASIARSVVADKIATGHTLDDRVETTLARLLHGAPPETLAGIPPSDGLRIRPLIDVRRNRTRAYCDEVGLPFDDDPANDDPRFERSRVRSRLVPEIENGWGDGALRAIARAAENLRQDGIALSELAERLYRDLAVVRPNEVRFDRASVDVLPRALRRRLLERAVGRVRDRSGGIEAALDALEEGKAPARFAVASGIEIEVRARDLLVSRGNAETDSEPLLSRDEQGPSAAGEL
jgi:tRNA(Ile)-lysidine synthase